MYKPKTHNQAKETPGREFIRLSDINKNKKIYYIGPYIELADGTFYIGKNPRYRGERLIKPTLDINFFGDSPDVRLYKKLTPKNYKFLNKTLEPMMYKNKPNDADYVRGHYTRYFLKKINEDFNYREVNIQTHLSIATSSKTFDYNLYIPGKIKWAITGNVYKANELSIKRLEDKFPYLSSLFPLLNEFQKPDIPLQTDLYTEGNELYQPNGEEYIGFYHIHPEKGPMEGPKHTDSPHMSLFYTQPQINKNRVDVSDKAFEEFKKQKQNEYKVQKDESKNIPKNIPVEDGNTSTLPSTDNETNISTTTTSISVSTQSSGPSAPSTGGGGY